MDRLLLRTLAKKSILGFGKYADMTIKNLLDLNRTTYLRWIYYNMDMISFSNEILEEIKISDDFKIQKPGKAPEKHDLLNDILWDKIGSFNKFKQESHRKKVRKARAVNRSIVDKKRFSKANLTRINHGH